MAWLEVETKVKVHNVEDMRKKVENTPILYKEHVINITASFGICCTKASSDKNMDTYVSCADSKLYEAKSKGRNRVEY